MATKRVFHTQTTLSNGKVLVTGGLLVRPDPNVGSLLEVHNTAELYDPAADTWSPAASMHFARHHHTATLLEDGRVLVVGGANFAVVSNSEIYDPSNDTWTEPLPLPGARGFHTATRLQNGKVLVAGGFTLVSDLFDPATNSWSSTGALSQIQSGGQATLLKDGRVVILTGSSRPEIYDPLAGTWSTTGPLFMNTFPTLSALNDGRALVTGGSVLGSNVYNLAPSTLLWSPDAPLLHARSNHVAVRLADGRVLVAGGSPMVSGENATTAETYTPTNPDTTPPQISAPDSVVAEQTSPAGATVSINASAVDETDGPVTVTSNAPAIFPPGKTTVTFTATDAAGNVAHATTIVYVVDTTPPTITSLTASPAKLWPPNAQYIPVSLAATVSDAADPNPISKIVLISSSQTSPIPGPSWVITGDLTAELRAEMGKNGSEQSYTLVVHCTDSSGNISEQTVQVKVEKP
jgi:hypothetical protein